MSPEETQALLASAKLTMVRYRNALQAILGRADDPEIARLAAVALRERPRTDHAP